MTGVDTGFYFSQHFSAAAARNTAVYGKDHKLNNTFPGSRQIKALAKQKKPARENLFVAKTIL